VLERAQLKCKITSSALAATRTSDLVTVNVLVQYNNKR